MQIVHCSMHPSTRFFGRNVLEEVELGGLEDEEDSSSVPAGAGGVSGGVGNDDIQEYHLFEKDEVYFIFVIFREYCSEIFH